MAKRETFKNSKGERVPAVTTVLNRFQESGALMGWANKVGRQGMTLPEAYAGPTNAGKLCHRLIRADLMGQPPELPDQKTSGLSPKEYSTALEQARRGFGSFLKWKGAHKIEVIATELSLVSEQHQYGGRLDAVIRLDGELVIPDWKAANDVYLGDVLQVAAYRQLWNENNTEQANGSLILRVGKEKADEFEARPYGLDEMRLAWGEFALLLGGYVMEAELKKALKAKAA